MLLLLVQTVGLLVGERRREVCEVGVEKISITLGLNSLIVCCSTCRGIACGI